jgi:hypothetical protein
MTPHVPPFRVITRNIGTTAEPVNVPAPAWTDRDTASTDLNEHRATNAPKPGPCGPGTCLCTVERDTADAIETWVREVHPPPEPASAMLTQRKARMGARAAALLRERAAARVTPPMIPLTPIVSTAENLVAEWRSDGLFLTWHRCGRVERVRVDERGQQALRNALGIGRR